VTGGPIPLAPAVADLPRRSREVQTLSPSSASLFERTSMQWQFGDWETLARLDPEDLVHHPDRATLALLVAGARQQLADQAGARYFVELAQEWGCEQTLIAQVLIAGVHNTLGCVAALSNHQSRAHEHFKAAVEGMGGDPRLTWQARSGHQLGLIKSLLQPGCDFHRPGVKARPLLIAPASAVDAAGADEAITARDERGNAALAKQLDIQLARRCSVLEELVTSEIQKSSRRLEAFVSIQSYLQPVCLMPSMHGWPISPELAQHLIRMIENNSYNLIIEFGSGVSTLIIAEALRRSSGWRESAVPVPQVAFEHLDLYHQKTMAMLKHAQAENAARVVLSPLVDEIFKCRRNLSYRYYECQALLNEVAASCGESAKKILVFVDGPPGATGKHARYPALPLVLPCFPAAAIDVLLDDYQRDDEQEIVAMWIEDLDALGRQFQLKKLKLERGACVVEIQAGTGGASGDPDRSGLEPPAPVRNRPTSANPSAGLAGRAKPAKTAH
jgi:hypothetical protein